MVPEWDVDGWEDTRVRCFASGGYRNEMLLLGKVPENDMVLGEGTQVKRFSSGWYPSKKLLLGKDPSTMLILREWASYPSREANFE